MARWHVQQVRSMATQHVQVQGYDMACNSEAQGNMGVRQCSHILPSPRGIAVIMLLLLVVMSCWALEGEEHNNWAAKEEVSKKQKQREDVPAG